ncbi:MAG TPA: hypothetical protein VHV81_17255 [Steroidobacteraceae bacterium]|nr:hypothetical protein [Steroidobacteraceae bacterium]
MKSGTRERAERRQRQLGVWNVGRRPHRLIAGSPLTIAVTYTVTGNAISDASYNVSPSTINVESPTDGTAATASIDIAAYDLPPYDAYVTSKTQSNAIASATFAQTVATGGALGGVTLQFKSPVALGPGLAPGRTEDWS